MDNFYARTVFFVRDGERSLKFYTETLGCSVEWKFEEEGRVVVFEVGLFGFALILNQTGPETMDRPGHGRVFIGLEDDQSEEFRKYIEDKGIKTTVVDWGAPTLVIRDIDDNELFFWFSGRERENLQARLANEPATHAE
jgi:catechol 2,3-dioxygenase-like lactoylglutathione lyase family enzyme